MIPSNSASAQTVNNVLETLPEFAAVLTAWMLNEPPGTTVFATKNVMITPVSNPMSPVRVVRNALIAARLFALSSHQCPMSMNEQRPTSSQPMSIISVLSATTSNNIDAVNNESDA